MGGILSGAPKFGLRGMEAAANGARALSQSIDMFSSTLSGPVSSKVVDAAHELRLGLEALSRPTLHVDAKTLASVDTALQSFNSAIANLTSTADANVAQIVNVTDALRDTADTHSQLWAGALLTLFIIIIVSFPLWLFSRRPDGQTATPTPPAPTDPRATLQHVYHSELLYMLMASLGGLAAASMLLPPLLWFPTAIMLGLVALVDARPRALVSKYAPVIGGCALLLAAICVCLLAISWLLWAASVTTSYAIAASDAGLAVERLRQLSLQKPVIPCDATISATSSLPHPPLVRGIFGLLPDSSFSASSFWGNDMGHSPRMSRLHSTAGIGGWACADNDKSQPWIEVNLLHPYVLRGVQTQSRQRDHEQWVVSFELLVSNDTATWTSLFAPDGRSLFSGNTNMGNVVTHALTAPVIAQHVRLVVHAHHNHPTLRWDVLVSDRQG